MPIIYFLLLTAYYGPLTWPKSCQSSTHGSHHNLAPTLSTPISKFTECGTYLHHCTDLLIRQTPESVILLDAAVNNMYFTVSGLTWGYIRLQACQICGLEGSYDDHLLEILPRTLNAESRRLTSLFI